MTTVNLGATSWTVAGTNLQLEVAASALLRGPDLRPAEDSEDLLANDLWIHKGHNFHISFHVPFNDSLSEPGALDEDAYAGFIASVLAQASLWSQLHLAPSVSAPVLVTSACGVRGRVLTLNLEQDGDSDSDLTNVKPPNAIAAISLGSVQISLAFSSIAPAPKKSLPLCGNASAEFEDLLGLEHDQEILEPDLEIPDWSYHEGKALEDHVMAFEMLLPPAPQALLREFDNHLESPSYLCANPGSLCLPDSSFHSLEAYDSIFSNQTSNLARQIDGDTTFSENQSILMEHERETSTTSSPLSTFHSLEPEDNSSPCRSARNQTASSYPIQPACIPIPPQDTTVLHQPTLNLLDTALRSLIHPQPTRLPAGIKPIDSHPSHEETTNRTPLSSLAPSIFTPDYARAVVERAPLVSSIAKSLATFLSHRPRSASRPGSGPGSGDSEDDGTNTQEELKETLRAHVWMTMTHGLSISHSEKARRLKSLAMPAVLSNESMCSGVEQTEEMDMEPEPEPETRMEILTSALVPETTSLEVSKQREQLNQDLEILSAFGSRGVLYRNSNADADADADDARTQDELLLFDYNDNEEEGEVDLSFLEEEFEELCLFDDGGGRSNVLEDCIVGDGNDDYHGNHVDDDDDDGTEEMLF